MEDSVANNLPDTKLAGGETKEEIRTVILDKDSEAPERNKKDEIEKEVKESFQDEDVPVEPVVGNDGLEVGGEG